MTTAQLQTQMTRRFKRLDGKLNQQFRAVDARFESLESPVGAVETRLDSVETRLDSMDARMTSQFAAVNRRLDSLGDKLDVVARSVEGRPKNVDRIAVMFDKRLADLERVHTARRGVRYTQGSCARWISSLRKWRNGRRASLRS